MSRQQHPRPSRRHGQVLIDAQAKENIRLRGTRRSLEVTRWTYHWTPPSDLSAEMPGDLRLMFAVRDYGDGVRRFWPAANFKIFAQFAFAAGFPLLVRGEGLDLESRQDIRRSKFIFDRVNSMQDYLKRDFRTRSSLYVGRRLTGGEIGSTVLPETLGNAAGQGSPWGVDELLQRGRERAVQAGIELPTEAIAIQRGFIAAAEADPLQASEQEALSLVRMALFDIRDDRPNIDAEQLDAVSDRLRDAFSEHLDEPYEDFKNWFSGGKSNLFKALARRAGYAEGYLDHQVVRRAFMELGWQAYRDVTRCMHAWNQAFLAALPEPLSADELGIFTQMYYPQSWLGGLSLPLLADRMSLISPVVTALLRHPGNQALIETLHRLLYYYSEMCAARRRADRAHKSRRNENGGLVYEVNDCRPEHHADSQCDNESAALVSDYLTHIGIRCPGGCDSDMSITIANMDDSTAEVHYACKHHPWTGTQTIAMADLRAYAAAE